MTVFEEIAAILYPLPEPGSVEPEGLYNDACWAVDNERRQTVAWLEGACDEGDAEPLLNAIGQARRRREQAEKDIRRLVAYGREFTRPRPYTLADLAEAAGMSISAMRTCYDHDQVTAVTSAIGRPSRDWRATDPAGDDG